MILSIRNSTDEIPSSKESNENKFRGIRPENKSSAISKEVCDNVDNFLRYSHNYQR